MNQLPSPDPLDRVDAPVRRPWPRRRLAVTVATASLLGVGGPLAGAQIAGATAPEADGSIVTDLEAQFEAFDACMAERLPEVFGDDAMSKVEMIEIDAEDFDPTEAMPDFEVPDNVAIHTGGAAGEFTVLDLGEGDSVITITKTDGEVQVSTDGDVREIDLEEFNFDEFDAMIDAEFEAELEQFDEAHEACEDTLPDSVEFVTGDELPAEEAETEE